MINALANKLQSFITIPLPWQQQQWRHLYRLHQSGRLAHALLFTGQAGLGKSVFAASFAKTLHCKQALASGTACQHCRDCLLVTANTHPDLSYIVPEKANKGIKIEQIRGIIQQINQTTPSAYKILIINPADSLLVSSSNALLKSLEEPTARTLFILITDKPGLLLPTIRSRCQIIRFTSPDKSVGKAWLREQLSENYELSENTAENLYNLAHAAPLQALEYAKTGQLTVYQHLLDSMLALLKKEIDPITLAECHLKTDLTTLLYFLMNIVSAVIKCQLQMHDPDSESVSVLHLLANKLNPTFLFNYFDRLLKLQQHIKIIALNQQLLLEDLFCHWSLHAS
ncbi:MAG: DNA polymerase III subunit delta' [Pseudomonadota bacterium]